MATGCCGVKKQKLASSSSSSVASPYANNNSSSASSSNGTTNGYCNGFSTSINGITSPSPKQTKVACKEMVIFCFDVLYNYLHSVEPPKSPKFPNEQFPLFVTWKLGKEKKLRGCIGTFNSTSLHQGLREYAITSACKDSRFDPITVEDFNRLHCSISLLLDFEVADHYLDWEIGIHGIRIEFSSEKGAKKAATYLPEVAVEQGWNQIQTIDSLLRKGGFKGTITPETRTGVCLIRFQSEKVTVSYTEYVAFKQGYCIDEPPSSKNHDGHCLTNGYHQTNSTSATSGSRSSASNSSAGRYSGGGHSMSNGYQTPAIQTSSSLSNGVGGHYRNHTINGAVGGGRSSPPNGLQSTTMTAGSQGQRTSHHPSPNAARYLPLPSHPYMPPPV